MYQSAEFTTLWTIDVGSRGPFVNRYSVVNLRLQANHGRCSNLEIIDQQYLTIRSKLHYIWNIYTNQTAPNSTKQHQTIFLKSTEDRIHYFTENVL